MQTGDKHVSEVTQDGHNYGFGGYKNEALPSLVRTKKVIGSHGDKTWLKLCKRQIQSSYHRSSVDMQK
jgi:hypothetical protein